ncbi:MAG: sigma-54-dependent Fis family transcriptional regulator [Acidobacteria bacterium]|nr:sigma-54-dependent Fis family transcriptional regulator [Acidobacteriota bacterium]
MPLCLVVEDEDRQRSLLAATLRAEGYETATAADGAGAADMCQQHRPELVLLDLGLPDIDGIELIPRLLQLSPLSRILVLTGRDSVASAVAALRAGARHYLLKPCDRDELLLAVEREARRVNFDETRLRLEPETVFWGSHPAMQRLRSQLERIAESRHTPVLLHGETGSGKEIVARELHRLGGGPGPFVALNCAAVPSELLESELFGHEKGAFTGAESRRRGMVELAHDGTLLLDEVGEMSPALQPKLLRFLQEHRFRRVGGEQELHSPSRVIAATHRDLLAQIDGGAFRSDLYYRLAVVELKIPALRDRREDLLPLTYFLLEKIARGMGRRPKPLDAAAEAAILAHGWPGNVRELQNRLERAMVLGGAEQIGVDDLNLLPRPAGAGPATAADEAAALRRVLEECGWNMSRAARRLGIERHALRYRMQKLGIHRK